VESEKAISATVQLESRASKTAVPGAVARRPSAPLFQQLIRWRAIRAVLAICDFGYDLLLWAWHSGGIHRRPRNPYEADYVMRVYCHRIEKALVLAGSSGPRNTALIDGLLGILHICRDRLWTVQPHTAKTLSAALGQFREEVPLGLADSRQWLERIDEALNYLTGPVTGNTKERVGYICGGHVSNDGILDTDPNIEQYFRGLVHGRHSVRAFAETTVPNEIIEDCVRLAQRSPSACNRQAVRVHVYGDAQLMRSILKCQNGNDGFGNTANRLLLLTFDQQAVLASSERNLPYLDVGLFAMTLVLALQARGVASCCLNLNNYWFRDRALRRCCGVPACEKPVLLIAVGYPPPNYSVAVSERLPLECVIRFHRPSLEESCGGEPGA
jgi:nitroreductase